MFTFFSSCVDWPQNKLKLLFSINDSCIDISRKTFLSKVDRTQLAEIEAELGYEAHPSRGLTMAGDYHVSYHRSRVRHKWFYFFRHSEIEYVFTQGSSNAQEI